MVLGNPTIDWTNDPRQSPPKSEKNDPWRQGKNFSFNPRNINTWNHNTALEAGKLNRSHEILWNCHVFLYMTINHIRLFQPSSKREEKRWGIGWRRCSGWGGIITITWVHKTNLVEQGGTRDRSTVHTCTVEATFRGVSRHSICCISHPRTWTWISHDFAQRSTSFSRVTKFYHIEKKWENNFSNRKFAHFPWFIFTSLVNASKELKRPMILWVIVPFESTSPSRPSQLKGNPLRNLIICGNIFFCLWLLSAANDTWREMAS